MPANNTQTGLSTVLFFFVKKLRLSNPWNYKVPLLMAMPYLVLFNSAHRGNDALITILLSLIIIIGVAGFGYLSNDLGDLKKDALIGKPNAVRALALPEIMLLYVLFLAMTLLPWIWMPMNAAIIALLFLQLVLFVLYSFPPFRFKEKGITGVITDALYAHVNPAVLAAYTYYLLCGKHFEGFWFWLVVLALWQFALGVRNILFHQLKDFEDDIKSGTSTFVTKNGIEKTRRWAATLILPLEAALFVAFMGANRTQLYLLTPFVLLYWMTAYTMNRERLRQLGFRERAYLLLDDLYVLWLPVFILLVLPSIQFQYIVVLLVHLIIFSNGPKRFILNRFGK